MIKIENVVLASPEQMEFVIQGMRNPMNSWEKSDSRYACLCRDDIHDCPKGGLVICENDHSLMQRLANAGTDHRKFMRMMPVYVRITAPLYWWKEFDTYKVGTVANSCSTMHKITDKEFDVNDFSHEHIEDLTGDDYNMSYVLLLRTMDTLNYYRNKYIETKTKPMKEESKRADLMKMYWWQMIQLLPSSYNQTRNIMTNYEVLANIYKSRNNHKLDEWRSLCDWIEGLLYSDLIISAAGFDPE